MNWYNIILGIVFILLGIFIIIPELMDGERSSSKLIRFRGMITGIGIIIGGLILLFS
jgi:hypothetical protein